MQPVVLNVTSQCQQSPSAKGKLQNPPTNVVVSVAVDGLPVTYSPTDSSFTYYINGTTNAGNHIVRVTYYNFAGSTIKDTSFMVSVCTGVGNLIHQSSVRLYPNPASDFLVIDSLDTQLKWQQLQIFNASGYPIQQSALINQRKLTLSTNGFKPGIYFVVLMNRQGQQLTLPFVKIN